MAELYNLPDGWEWKKLGAICNLLNGYAFKAKDYVEISDTVLIRMGNIRPNGEFDAEHKIQYLPNKYSSELSNYILNDGDLIIAMTDMATEMKILGIPTLVENTNGRTFMLNQRVGKLYDFKLDKINIEYLRYILSANQIKEYYKSLGGGGLQINIGKQQILSVDFPLPPLEEQKRIVAKLDNLFAKIDKAIALHQKNIDEANVFMASVLNDVFVELKEKYEKRTIESFSKVGTGVTPLKNRNDFYENGNINWITSKATNDDYVYESEQLITEIALNECRLKINPIGTIIVALYGQGKTRGQVSELMIESTTNQALATIIVDENESINTYLKYFLKKSYFDIREKASGGTQPNLNLSIIKNIELPLPPLKTQQKVVSYLDEISQKMEKIKQIQKEKMQNLKALKASILDQAFKGEL